MVLQVFLKSSRVRTDTFIFSMVYTSQQTISINFRCIMYLESVSCSVISDCLQPHGLQHARLPCPSPTPRTCSNFKLMSIELVMPSKHLILCCPLLLLPSVFPRSGSFPVSQLFTSGGQSIRVSASPSVLPMNIQD